MVETSRIQRSRRAGVAGGVPRRCTQLSPVSIGLVGQRTGSLFHGLVPLGQRLGHLGVADTLCPGDEPGDQVVGSPSPATGGLGPTLHPAVQHRGHVGGVGQGPAGHQAREGRLDVEAAGFGVAEGGQERTVRRAGSHGCEVCVASVLIGRARRPSARAWAIVASVRYSAESRSMPSASYCWRRIMSWAATSAPSLRSTPASTSLAVTGSDASSWEVCGSGS